MNYRQFMKETLLKAIVVYEEKGMNTDLLLNQHDPELELVLRCAWLVHLEQYDVSEQNKLKMEYNCPNCDGRHKFENTGGFDNFTEENYVVFKCSNCSGSYSPTHGSDKDNLPFVRKNLDMTIGEAILWVEQIREIMEEES